MSDKIKFCKNCRSKMTPKFYGYMPNSKDICPICNNKVIEVNLTDEDYWIIHHISKDVNFLEAMIKLHNDDIIEYELKMSQFRNQAEQQKQIEFTRKQQENNTIHCPYCNSENIKKISGTERVASATMFGIFSKKIGKSFKCSNCGGTF